MTPTRTAAPSPKRSRRRLNASQDAKRYYGLHMAPGVADYDEDGQRERIYLSPDAIRRMNPSFSAKPVYALHQEVNLETLHEDADGYVVKSFYNPADGNIWCEFIASTDAAHEAIREGWKLSNAFVITRSAGGGTWHNVPYDLEVVDGIFEHLALVPNPRYEESTILTPEEFQAYNQRMENELRTLQNSKGNRKMPFRLFQRKKVTNADQLSNAVVQLEDGTEVPFQRVLRAVAAERAGRRKKNGRASGGSGRRLNADGVALEEEVTVGDSVMTVRELIQAYLEVKGRAIEDERNSADSDLERENESDDDDEDEDKKKKKKMNAKVVKALQAAIRQLDPVSARAGADTGDGEDDDDQDERDDRRSARLSNSREEDDPDDEPEADDPEGDEEDGGEEADPVPQADRRANSRRGGDDDEDENPGERRPPARGREQDRARAKAGGGGNARKRRNSERDTGDGGKLVRLSPHEFRMVKESRSLLANSLKNAKDQHVNEPDDEGAVDTQIDRVKRGLEIYGSAPDSGQKH